MNSKRAQATLLGLGIALWGSSAAAFCRTTTCNPYADCTKAPGTCCEYDADGCDVAGDVVRWPTSCVSYQTHRGGSKRLGLTEPQLSKVLEKAFDAWISVECDGEPLSIAIEDRGPSDLGDPEFNEDLDSTNNNVWMFQDDPRETNNVDEGSMQIDTSSLAVSVITYDYENAELVDVDVEFNSASAELTIDDDNVIFDLQSIATHEAGHFLGLDHTREPDATMRAHYSPGDRGPRTLSEDDEAAICAAYPPERHIKECKQTCEPYGKGAPNCRKKGCSYVAGPNGPSKNGAPWVLAAFAFAWASRWRRRPSL